MANFRYNPNSGQIDRVGSTEGSINGASDAAGGNLLKTEFFVMNEGRLVFSGSQEQLRASDDSYIRKFVK
jgi:hypothetical protein